MDGEFKHGVLFARVGSGRGYVRYKGGGVCVMWMMELVAMKVVGLKNNTPMKLAVDVVAWWRSFELFHAASDGWPACVGDAADIPCPLLLMLFRSSYLVPYRTSSSSPLPIILSPLLHLPLLPGSWVLLPPSAPLFPSEPLSLFFLAIGYVSPLLLPSLSGLSYL